jgi:hypothetical protein
LTSPPGSASGTVVEKLTQSSLRFEPNEGQTASQIQFTANGPGYSLFLTGGDAVIELRSGGTTATGAATALRMQVVGANPDIQGVGLDQLSGKVNYFIGSDPAKWRVDIPTYRAVQFDHLYHGINLVYYGNQQQLEYDFVVAPGADPSIIRLELSGADDVGLDAQGNLVMRSGSQDIIQHKPTVYQDLNGSRQLIPASFVLTPDDSATTTHHSPLTTHQLSTHELTFELGSYDPTQPLVIDPVLSYSTYLGGSRDDDAFGVAVDATGAAYVTGATFSPDFPTTIGAYQGANGGNNENAYIDKLDPTGTSLVYATYLGGSGGLDRANAIAVDAGGNAFVTGRVNSTDFPTTPGAFQRIFNGGDYDAFVTKLSPAGDALVYSTYLGGSNNDAGYGITVDANDYAYVVGGTKSDDFPATANSYQYFSYSTSAFMTVLYPDGSGTPYSTFLGGSFSMERANAVAVDSAGDVYFTGQTPALDFPTQDAFQDTYGGGPADAFVAKMDPSQSGDASLIWSTFLGGKGDDRGFGIALDGAGNVYVTGETSSTDFPTLNAIQPTHVGGNYNAFVTKFTGAGALVYSTYLGGSGNDGATGIAVDAAGDVYLTGFTSSTDFPTLNAIQPANNGGFDAFVTKVDPAGDGLIYSTYLGGSGDENTPSNDVHSGSIAVDSAGAAVVVGRTDSTDFPTQNPIQAGNAGGYDAFVAKLF